jgi:hypothetical protein
VREVHREHGILGAGRGPASLEDDHSAPDTNHTMDVMRVLVPRSRRPRGPRVARMVAARNLPLPSPAFVNRRVADHCQLGKSSYPTVFPRPATILVASASPWCPLPAWSCGPCVARSDQGADMSGRRRRGSRQPTAAVTRWGGDQAPRHAAARWIGRCSRKSCLRSESAESPAECHPS